MFIRSVHLGLQGRMSCGHSCLMFVCIYIIIILNCDIAILRIQKNKQY